MLNALGSRPGECGRLLVRRGLTGCGGASHSRCCNGGNGYAPGWQRSVAGLFSFLHLTFLLLMAVSNDPTQGAQWAAERLNTDLMPREAALRLLRIIVVSGSLLTLCLAALLWVLL
jgi:hypothetical protein